jgi:hypothetical protein
MLLDILAVPQQWPDLRETHKPSVRDKQFSLEMSARVRFHFRRLWPQVSVQTVSHKPKRHVESDGRAREGDVDALEERWFGEQDGAKG